MGFIPGLEGVVVGETSISHVEGDLGRLSYRGYRIGDIIAMDYLEVAYLVLFGQLPKASQLEEFSGFMTGHGRLAESDVGVLQRLPRELHPMKMLQAMIPVIRLSDARFGDVDTEASRGLQILAKYPALIAAIRHRKQEAAGYGEFDEHDEYLSRYLTMMNGDKAESRSLEIFKSVQLLQMDHSFNAGTFASRVISSTLAPIDAVLAGAVGALSGILHGGADEAALRSAREVGCPKNARAYVDELLAKKGRLMGMGHREYRTVDPRSVILKPLAEELCRGTEFESDFNTLLALETAFNASMRERGKDVWANVEFYKGVVYEALGIGTEYFTTTFALSRSVGWLAHFIESRVNNRIIRPAAHYVGPDVRPAISAA